MSVTLVQLRRIAEAVMDRLRAFPPGEVQRILVMIDYHGFAKSRFPEPFLHDVVTPLGLDPKDIQLEVVHVGCDLTHEVHEHREAMALAVCLGNAEGFPPPTDALAFVTDHWFAVSAGETVEIPAGTPHGFTVNKGGTVHFLSVQSPPIVREDGHDDYYRM